MSPALTLSLFEFFHAVQQILELRVHLGLPRHSPILLHVRLGRRQLLSAFFSPAGGF